VSKIVYIADALLEDLIGGGELNDYELCNLLSNAGKDVRKIRSHLVRKQDLSPDDFYIISNFVNVPRLEREYIQNNCDYVIYEHDHKYLRSRNPALYEDYKAPPDQIINVDFYKKAKMVFCQSSFHESIIKKNIGIKNIKNISGNLWSEDSLSVMRILSRREKRDCYSILNSTIGHKNTRETAFYCEQKKYNYDPVSSNNYQEFLSLLSNNNKFMFFPKTPETLSRVVVEARMMNMKVVTNRRVGASYEPWFELKGEDLIDLMLKKRTQVRDMILELM
tara:strand:+ start:234 stop:1067 length:834 start_codon:yes stop_codon:yes gene_type:complete